MNREDNSAAVWNKSLKATCNRLITQYLNLIRAASSEKELDDAIGSDPRAGGGTMKDASIPPPPLAASTSLSSLNATLSSQNICMASTELLDLIRTLRMSALLMEEGSIRMEEDVECWEDSVVVADVVSKEGLELEKELLQIRENNINRESEPLNNSTSSKA